MKRASVIAIIVAFVLMFSGAICCAVGSAASKKEGFMLFPETENGESVFVYELDGRNISRITVSAGDAKIRLTRGGERSYVKIRNYNANYYRLNEENTTLSFAEIDDVLSMFKFWEGISFKGMRYFISSGTDRADAHVIEINLAGDYALRSVSLNLEKGDISLEDFNHDGDITMKVNEGRVSISNGQISGSVSVSMSDGEVDISGLNAHTVSVNTDNVQTNARALICESFKWYGGKKSLAADGVETKEFTADSTDAAVSVTNLKSTNTSITTKGGEVKVALPLTLGKYSTEIASKSGNIFVDATQYKASCSLTSENAPNTLKISTDSASVELKSSQAPENNGN